MGGIDLNDGLLTSYATTRIKHKKHYIKEFKHLLDITCLNAYIIYNKCNNKISRFDFMVKLIESMIETFKVNEEKELDINRNYFMPTRINAQHYPVLIEPTERKADPRRRCFICSKNNIRKDTRYICKECDIGLCAAPCFAIFHKKNTI